MFNEELIPSAEEVQREEMDPAGSWGDFPLQSSEVGRPFPAGQLFARLWLQEASHAVRSLPKPRLQQMA